MNGERPTTTVRLAIVAVAAVTLVACASEDSLAPAGDEVEGRCVLRAEVDGIISVGTARHLDEAVDAAEASECEALLIVIDTPGGVLSATRQIVRAQLGAEVPVITWVGPSGARAGSAGMFLTLAGHVAAMAPGTNIGAAHPVTAAGQDPSAEGGEHLGRKVEADSAAFARTIAERRGRNVQWAERAVRESISSTSEEALDQGVVDLVVDDQRALLDAIDGRTVELGDGERRLHTAGAEVRDVPMSTLQRVLAVLGDPSLAYLLIMVGVLGLVIELYNPGMIVPGALGVVALLFGSVGMGSLPIEVGGVALVVIAAVLLIAELFVVSYGLLSLAGLAALLAGAFVLIDTSDPEFFVDATFSASWMVVVPFAVVMAATVGALAWRGGRLRRQMPRTGVSGLLGSQAVVVEPVDQTGGRVRLGGERWAAVSPEALEVGQRVQVVDVEGLQLTVETFPGDDSSEASHDGSERGVR